MLSLNILKYLIESSAALNSRLTLNWKLSAGISKPRSPTLSEKNVKFFLKSAPRMGMSANAFGDDTEFYHDKVNVVYCWGLKLCKDLIYCARS